MRNFKELLIWQKGMDLWMETYKFSKQLPKEERFGLISQINRAASSIPANIAEGSGRSTDKDYARFVQISLGSAFELETFLIGLQKLGLANDQDVSQLLSLLVDLQKMLSGFLRKLRM